jgi:hypothetical protein
MMGIDLRIIFLANPHPQIIRHATTIWLDDDNDESQYDVVLSESDTTKTASNASAPVFESDQDDDDDDGSHRKSYSKQCPVSLTLS